MKVGLPSSRPSPPSHRGFTLIEVIAVLVILGVLAAVSIGRIPQSNTALITERDQLAAHLRYTQLRALADVNDWQLKFTSPTTYRITGWVDGAPAFVPIPGSGSTTRSLSGGVSVAGTPVVQYDTWGRLLGGRDQTLELSGGGGNSSILIRGETGFIP